MNNRLTAFFAATLVCIPALAQWTQQPFSSATEYLFKVRFVNATTGWVLGSKKIYKTTDAGLSWMPQDTVLNGGGYGLYALSPSVAFFCEFPSTGPYRGLRKTTDGGATWRTVDTSRIFYFRIKFPTPQIGYAACGSLGTPYLSIIRKTTDGGETWQTIATLDAGFEFQSISFIDPQQGWAVSYRGLVYRTTDGGTSWNFQDSVGNYAGYTIPMRDITFTTRDSGWAVGGLSGTMGIARTINGGVTWQKTFPGGSSLREVTFINSQSGWFVGTNNGGPFVARTTNGGESWQTQSQVPEQNGFESLSMVDKDLGWAVGGSNGSIYKTTNGGITAAQDEHARFSSFRLEQNYPNPFNPGTVIRFSLPQREYVLLKVFDVRGKELETLLDQNLATGEHSVTWKPTDLPSGVYFYRLHTTSGMLTKKLILLR